MNALLPAAAGLYDLINAAASREELDELQHLIWKRYWPAREISDHEAQFLTEAISKRKPARATITARAVSSLNCRSVSRFTPRPCRKRLTDEERTKRRRRKRMLGGSSAMAETIREHFTEGERAAMCIVAGEVKMRGICDLSIDEIGDRAGVGRTTVQNAMHEARRLGLLQIIERPQRGAKHLTNIVKIISAEWLAWIKRGPSAARGIGSKSFANVSTSKNIDLKIGGERGANRSTGVPIGWHPRALQGMRSNDPPGGGLNSPRRGGQDAI
jgi:hypothetical protein